MYGLVYRHLLLPLFDTCWKGRETLRFWDEIENSQWWPAEKLEQFQTNALRRLFEHAETTCRWYAQEWRRRGLAASDLTSLADLSLWPLLSRSDIRANRAAMRTTAPCRLNAKSTGGSSGEPLQFDLDTGSNDRRTAQAFRGYNWAGAGPGSKQLYIWGGASPNLPWWKRTKLALHAGFERKHIIDCFAFTPEQMPRHFEAMQRYRADVIVAYTNPLYEFARFLDDNGLQPHPPRGIVVGAEKLHDFQRQLIEKVFAAPVFETYGSREFMLIGAECERHEGLHLSCENLHVEIVDDEGRPTPAGEEGNVVITDLFNYGMPFIRYVNGDRAVAGWDVCSCGRGLPLMSRVTGRQLDMLETPDGRKVPGEFFPHTLKDFGKVRRFQVAQGSPERITVRIVAPDFTTDDQEQLANALRIGTGWNVHLEIERVADIPLTKHGKHRVVVREERPAVVTVSAR